MSQQSDFVASQVDRPTRIGGSLPSTCKRGELFFLVGLTNKIYASFSTNVWTELGTSAGATPSIPSSAPTGSDSTGTAGQIAYDGTFIYICVATNTWLRAPLSDFATN